MLDCICVQLVLAVDFKLIDKLAFDELQLLGLL
jgi:hypothetical protein